jgi:hypothetical protein
VLGHPLNFTEGLDSRVTPNRQSESRNKRVTAHACSWRITRAFSDKRYSLRYCYLRY